ncbi:hypothetical protein GGR54DRAFT_648346, partial [Hypoxylon sp. NC1633]
LIWITENNRLFFLLIRFISTILRFALSSSFSVTISQITPNSLTLFIMDKDTASRSVSSAAQPVTPDEAARPSITLASPNSTDIHCLEESITGSGVISSKSPPREVEAPSSHSVPCAESPRSSADGDDTPVVADYANTSKSPPSELEAPSSRSVSSTESPKSADGDDIPVAAPSSHLGSSTESPKLANGDDASVAADYTTNNKSSPTHPQTPSAQNIQPSSTTSSSISTETSHNTSSTNPNMASTGNENSEKGEGSGKAQSEPKPNAKPKPSPVTPEKKIVYHRRWMPDRPDFDRTVKRPTYGGPLNNDTPTSPTPVRHHQPDQPYVTVRKSASSENEPEKKQGDNAMEDDGSVFEDKDKNKNKEKTNAKDKGKDME